MDKAEARLKMLRMRSWRRGMKEMDLILGRYADERLAALPAPALDAYEAMLEVNDQDLYKWVGGAVPCPAAHFDTLAAVAAFHGISEPIRAS